MNGQAIGALPIGEADRRRLASEQDGPRPGGVRAQEQGGAEGNRKARATRP